MARLDDSIHKSAEVTLVSQHQDNYARITQLRREAELLDAKIKISVQLLADIRKELLSIPLDASKEATRPVPYKDLLVYAKNISPFTVPPSFRPKPTPTEAEKPLDGAVDSNEHAIASTPAVDGVDPTAQDEEGSRTLNALSEEHKQWISDLGNLPFLPWPGDADMAIGALQALNYQTMHGNDPTDIARLVQEEEDRKLRAEEDSEKSELPYVQRQARGASRQAEAAPKPKARFGLDDSDDEDD